MFEENDGSLKNVHAAVARGRQMVRARASSWGTFPALPVLGSFFACPETSVLFLFCASSVTNVRLILSTDSVLDTAVQCGI